MRIYLDSWYAVYASEVDRFTLPEYILGLELRMFLACLFVGLMFGLKFVLTVVSGSPKSIQDMFSLFIFAVAFY